MAKNKQQIQKQIPEKAAKSKAFHELYTDTQYVSPELADYIVKKGLEFRWINLNHYRKMGFHKTGCVPFKRDDATPLSTADQLLGVRPDGFIVRGDNVLAVKPIEQAEAYRAHLAQKNKAMTGTLKKAGVSELKDAFKDAGVKAEIHEGYEDSE